jgi:hypothetical protein
MANKGTIIVNRTAKEPIAPGNHGHARKSLTTYVQVAEVVFVQHNISSTRGVIVYIYYATVLPVIIKVNGERK